MRRVFGILAAAGLAGCTVLPPPPAPLIAVPGPNKPQAVFAQDDLACRGAAARLAPAPGAALVQSPAVAYLQCMQSRNNVIEPLPTVSPVYYAYPAYPVYAGFGDYEPFLFAGEGIGFGFGGGYFGGGYGGGFRERGAGFGGGFGRFGGGVRR